jgi:hypothetical protein
MARKPFNFEKADKSADVKKGIKENSRKDKMLDAKSMKTQGGKAGGKGARK